MLHKHATDARPPRYDAMVVSRAVTVYLETQKAVTITLRSFRFMPGMSTLSCSNRGFFSNHEVRRGNYTAAGDPSSTLRGRQADKLDQLLHELGQETQGESNGNVPATGDHVTISPRKRALPFLESPTSPYFSIRILDSDSQAEKDRHSRKQSQSRQSFSIFQGKIVSGQTYLDSFHESTLDPPRMSHGKISPLNELDFGQVSYLLDEYRSMVDYLYPIVDLTRLTQLTETILVGDSGKSSNIGHQPSNVVDNIEVAMLKVLLTIVLPDQNQQKNDLASRLHQSVRGEVGHMVWNSDVDLNGIALLLLVVRLISRFTL